MLDIPASPQPHFPSPYARPTRPPVTACFVNRPDGAQIACFVYTTCDDLRCRGNTAAPPILMLHGNGEEHGIFGPIVDAIVDAGQTVIAIDSRAQGKSTRGTAALTYELMADDALATLDALDVRRVHVLGFSDGGIEALLLARDHSERVASVTALGANLTPEGVMAEPEWDLEGAIAINRAWARYWGAEGDAGMGDHSQTVDVSLLTPTPHEAASAAELLQLMLDEPHIDAASLGAISCPTTIMVGEFDCIADYETASIVANIPNARLVVAPGVGHTLPKHAPNAVTRELLATIGTGAPSRKNA